MGGSTKSSMKERLARAEELLQSHPESFFADIGGYFAEMEASANRMKARAIACVRHTDAARIERGLQRMFTDMIMTKQRLALAVHKIGYAKKGGKARRSA